MIEKKKYSQVPVSRLSRFFEFGSMTFGITGNIISSATNEYLKGKKPDFKSLVQSNENINTFVKSVSKMRGAALKIGQLISLEGGDFLPKEAKKALSLLRNDAHVMPPKQLKKILSISLGDNFIKKFNYFDINPIASASIGQVHKAETKDGKKIAIKIQYPGVKKSIKSDINNLALLLKAIKIVPSYIDLDTLLESAKEQLELETDYLREAKYQKIFCSLIKNKKFKIPNIIDDLTTQNSLAMDFIEGKPVNILINEDQNTKNEVIFELIKLFFLELFEFKIMQTDPNYANFYIEKVSNKIILLDFGASTEIKKNTSDNFKNLLKSTFIGNKVEIRNDMKVLGIISDEMPYEIISTIIDEFIKLTEPFRKNEQFDFNSKEIQNSIEKIKNIINDNEYKFTLPEFEVLLIQRKIGGIFLLAKQFNTQINLNNIIEKYIK